MAKKRSGFEACSRSLGLVIASLVVIASLASKLKSDPAYAHFLMAHACCHHTLGHTRLTKQRLGAVGV
jgi:hypothetical protein